MADITTQALGNFNVSLEAGGDVLLVASPVASPPALAPLLVTTPGGGNVPLSLLPGGSTLGQALAAPGALVFWTPRKLTNDRLLLASGGAIAVSSS